MRLATGILLLVVPFLCFAQEELNDDRKILKRPNVNAAMSEPVYKRLSRIHDQMGEDQFNEALDGLRKLENQGLSKYEKALVQQTFGFVYAQQGNEAEAIKRFNNSLEMESLPAQAHQGMLYSLAGLHAAEGEYLKSIETAREWFRYEKEPVADAYMLIGSSFAELERFGDSLPYVLKAIEKADKPHENWYMLAVSIRFQQDRYREAASLLVTMLQHWPDKVRYWEMLSGCYLELEDDKRALDSMMLAYANGMITKPERVKALVQLSMMRDMPYTAGTILDEELAKGTLESDETNLKMLLQAWLSAREYESAVDVINRLEKFSDDGEYFLRAAQIYNETGSWQKVVDNTNKALDLGLESPQDALMLAGIAHSELGQFDEATRVFNRMRAVGDSDDRRNADSWIAFIAEKRQLGRARLGSD